MDIRNILHSAHEERKNNILKGFVSNESPEEVLEKARNVGDIHPNGKWVWTQLPSGKFDWRVITTTRLQVNDNHKGLEEKLSKQLNNTKVKVKSVDYKGDYHKVVADTEDGELIFQVDKYGKILSHQSGSSKKSDNVNVKQNSEPKLTVINSIKDLESKVPGYLIMKERKEYIDAKLHLEDLEKEKITIQNKGSYDAAQKTLSEVAVKYKEALNKKLQNNNKLTPPQKAIYDRLKGGEKVAMINTHRADGGDLVWAKSTKEKTYSEKENVGYKAFWGLMRNIKKDGHNGNSDASEFFTKFPIKK